MKASSNDGPHVYVQMTRAQAENLLYWLEDTVDDAPGGDPTEALELRDTLAWALYGPKEDE